MWDWAHLKEEGWVAHTQRAIKLATLLLLSGAAMVVHMVVPFWQQPKILQACEVSQALCRAIEERKRE